MADFQYEIVEELGVLSTSAKYLHIIMSLSNRPYFSVTLVLPI
ncbi:hypothetical protein [Pseudobutyrivibrio sp.]|nr:hypothetical protein [Pseudobutyrivibrio sp.]